MAENNQTLMISAYFADLHLTEMGGRRKNLCESKYIPSLKSLKKMEVPFAVWYDANYHHTYPSLLRTVLDGNDVLLPYNLFAGPFYSKIKRLKTKYQINGCGEQRTYDLFIHRVIMMQETLRLFPDYEYYWWIDAGLSYESLFPHKYLPFLKEQHHWQQFAECTVFRPCIVQNLNQDAGDQFSVFMINRCEYPWLNDLFSDFRELNKTIIGGLMGGKKEVFSNFLTDFIPFIDDLLDRDYLALDETYFTMFWMKHPELFKIHPFYTWYNDDHHFAHDERGKPPKGKAFFHWIEEMAEIPITPYEAVDYE